MTLDGGLMGVSALAALGYGAGFIDKPPSVARTLVKTAPVGALAVLAYLADAPTLLVAALAFSAAGDAFLAGEPKTWLRAGLGAFLMAHISYIWMFAHDGGGRAALSAEPVRILGVAGALAVAVTLLAWLWDALGALRPAVTLYGVALAAMTGAAFTLPTYLWPAMPGAVSFLASDALLSAELFKDVRSPLSSQSVWWLYYAAQAAITYAYLR